MASSDCPPKILRALISSQLWAYPPERANTPPPPLCKETKLEPSYPWPRVTYHFNQTSTSSLLVRRTLAYLVVWSPLTPPPPLSLLSPLLTFQSFLDDLEQLRLSLKVLFATSLWGKKNPFLHRGHHGAHRLRHETCRSRSSQAAMGFWK